MKQSENIIVMHQYENTLITNNQGSVMANATITNIPLRKLQIGQRNVSEMFSTKSVEIFGWFK